MLCGGDSVFWQDDFGGFVLFRDFVFGALGFEPEGEWGSAGGLRFRAMSDLQTYCALGLPCLTEITTLILSMPGIKRVRQDVREIRNFLRTIVKEVGL